MGRILPAGGAVENGRGLGKETRCVDARKYHLSGVTAGSRLNCTMLNGICHEVTAPADACTWFVVGWPSDRGTSVGSGKIPLPLGRAAPDRCLPGAFAGCRGIGRGAGWTGMLRRSGPIARAPFSVAPASAGGPRPRRLRPLNGHQDRNRKRPAARYRAPRQSGVIPDGRAPVPVRPRICRPRPALRKLGDRHQSEIARISSSNCARSMTWSL